MIKNDKWIKEQAQKGMIYPFENNLVRQVSRQRGLITDEQTIGVLSYGLSSYGYDIRLSSKEFAIFQHIPGSVINPKRFNPETLKSVKLHSDNDGDYFILPAHSYGLGVALERLEIPANVTAICIGKSSYARCGLICNPTPLNAGWRGHLTLEFSNSSSADCRLYANEGVSQLLFLEGDQCNSGYNDRCNHYQDQLEEITLPKI